MPKPAAKHQNGFGLAVPLGFSSQKNNRETTQKNTNNILLYQRLTDDFIDVHGGRNIQLECLNLLIDPKSEGFSKSLSAWPSH